MSASTASYLPEGFEAATSALERSNIFRRRGNELYSKARDLAKDVDPYKDLKGVQESMKLYQAAMVEYGKALHFLPNDHRLYANRGLCYKAVEDWLKCKEDAQQCIKLQKNYVKGWLLLVKSIWELGKHADALQELQNGLKAIPGSRDLLDLQAALTSGCQARSAGRSVSPACTPGNTPSVSRSNTPPRHGTPPPPPPPGGHAVGHAATLPAIDSSGRSPGNSRTSSRSPGPGGRLPCPPSRVGAVPNLEGSLTLGGGTGNFGVPTPSFAHGSPALAAEDTLGSRAPGGPALGASGTFGASTTFGPRVGPGPVLDGPKDRSVSPGPQAGADGGACKRSLKSLSESGRR